MKATTQLAGSVDFVNQDDHEHRHVGEAAVPWVSSFLMHAGIGLMGLFLFFMAVKPMVETQGEIIIPSSFVDPADPDSKLAEVHQKRQGKGEDPLRETLQDLVKIQSNGVDPRGTATGLLGQAAGAGDKILLENAFISSGTGASLGREGETGLGGPGRIAGWGPTGGGGDTILPQTHMGVKRVVYLLDHSGSMLDTFDFLRQEVKVRTRELKPFQMFSVVMFSEDVEVVGPSKLQNAYNHIKEEVAQGMDGIRAQGQNDDLLAPFQKGFETAFAMQPEEIYFLTDGNFDPRLVEVVKRLNKAGKVKVQTIAFVKISAESEKSLQQIAKDSGGNYRFVSEKMLGK